jgi:hypothetical protein
LRKLGTGLESPPNTAEIRVTDYGGKGFNNVLVPALAIENNAMFVVYKLARNGKHTINRLLIPLSAQDLVGTGISNKPSPKDKKGDRVLGGNSVALNGENVPGDAPSIACGRDGCFVVWHGERGGAYAARLDSSTGSVVANPVLGAKASHPNIAANGDRDVLVTFYEGGRVKVAPLTRDGIGPSSTIGLIRIGGNEQTRPTVVSGIARGEWFVSWLDMEGKHSEVYVARVVCR